MTRMRLPLALAAAALVITGCAPAPAAGDPNAPVVAFYGDSYTLGTGASDTARRWSTIICTDRGWNEFNPSVNGLGFVNNRRPDVDLPSLVIAEDPDIVFVTMGLNDNFSYGAAADEIRAAIDADLSRLKAELPDARFIVVEPFWYTDERPESVEVIIGWVHAAGDAIGADWIPDASHWIEGHPEWMASDGLHPNDDGYAEMARRMDAALTELGL
jgi:lysophospholipase L1-like esterase